MTHIVSTGESIEVMLTRMEGKIDRMNDRMERHEKDYALLRQRVHDLANEISPVVMLNVPNVIRDAERVKAEYDARISALESVEHQRKGAATVIRILCAVAGAVGVGGVAAVLRLFQIGGI